MSSSASIRSELGGGSVTAPTGAPVGGARAHGGRVRAGHLYAVGGRGVEVFAPGEDGSIIPNHALGGGGRSAAGRISVHAPISVTLHVNGADQDIAAKVEAAAARAVEKAVEILDTKLARSTRAALTSTRYGDI